MDPEHLMKIPLLLFAVVWAAVFFGATARNTAWPVTVALGAFRWWWETRSRDKDGRTTCTRHGRVVGAVRLPITGALPPVAIGEEGMFAKLGLGGRGDMQLESEEFNRRFRVEV